MNHQDIVKVKKLLLENKHTQQEIGDMFDVSRGTISDIARNKRYRDIEPRLQAVKIAGGQQKHLNIETQNIALTGMVENLRQERNLLKRQLKAASKRLSIVDGIVEQLLPVIKPLKPGKVYTPPARKAVIHEEMGLLFSDNHCDQVVTPEEVDGLEDYNFPVSARRHEVLVEELLKWKDDALSNFQFARLNLFALGDYTSGEIHGHVNRSYFGDQFTNDLAIASLFAQVFRELASHFPEIVITSIIGNHGRLTDKIEFTKEAVAANHDTLIMKIAEVHCQDISNIKFKFPAGLSTIETVLGWNFFLHHGHGKKGSSETWARAKRKSGTIVPLHRGKINYFCSGHFHTPGDVAVSGGATMLGNGAFLDCDQYSYQNIDEAGDACQLLFGVHKHNGVSWRLPVKLRTGDEGLGPNRYDIMEKS